jgi:hypothetical protein
MKNEKYKNIFFNKKQKRKVAVALIGEGVRPSLDEGWLSFRVKSNVSQRRVTSLFINR